MELVMSTHRVTCHVCGKSFERQGYKKDDEPTCYRCKLDEVCHGRAPEEGDFNTALFYSGEMSDREVQELNDDLYSVEHGGDSFYRHDNDSCDEDRADRCPDCGWHYGACTCNDADEPQDDWYEPCEMCGHIPCFCDVVEGNGWEEEPYPTDLEPELPVEAEPEPEEQVWLEDTRVEWCSSCNKPLEECRFHGIECVMCGEHPGGRGNRDDLCLCCYCYWCDQEECPSREGMVILGQYVYGKCFADSWVKYLRLLFRRIVLRK